MRRSWHIERSPERLVLSRRGDEVFDVSSESHFPHCARARLAHQIRQDLWRELQGVRGFSPVVVIEKQGEGLSIIAGGAVAGQTFPKAKIDAKIVALLADTKKRSRWLSFAAIKEPKNA